MPATTTTYPYFRSDVKFTKSMMDGTTAFQFFFNKTRFLIGMASGTKVSKLDEDMTARENVMFLLKHLFVTSFPISDNLETSFDVNIQKTNTHVSGRNSFVPEFIADMFLGNTHQAAFTYVTMRGTRYTVLGVTWMNDVINHPLYFKLLTQIKKYIMKKEEKLKLIEQKMKTFLLPKFTLDLFQKVNKFIRTEPSELTKDISELITNAELAKIFTGKKDEDVDKGKLLEKLTPEFYKLYVSEKDLNKRYYVRGRYTEFDRATKNADFKQLMNLSTDYYLNLSLKSFFSGSSIYNTKNGKLLDSYKSDSITELFLFQTFLVTDSDFCAMMSQISEFVSPELMARNKGLRFSESRMGSAAETRLGWLSTSGARSLTEESNPILKKVKFLKQHYLSTNRTFQNAIDDYFKSGCTDPNFDAMIKNGPVDEAIRLALDSTAEPYVVDIPDHNVLRIDAIKRISELEEKEKYWYDERPAKDKKKPLPFVIEVQLELMKGLVNEMNAPKIYCAFEDKRLQNEYSRLKAKLDKSIFYKSRPFLSIDNFPSPPDAAAKKKVGGGRDLSRHRGRHRQSSSTRKTRCDKYTSVSINCLI